jgi:hypothetical protein
MSGSLIALAGGPVEGDDRDPLLTGEQQRLIGIAGHSFEEDRGHRVGGVDETVSALAEHPGGGHLIHCAEEHLGGDLHGQVGVEIATSHTLLETEPISSK